MKDTIQREGVAFDLPELSGDYASDCSAGRDFADDLVRKMIEENKPMLLCWLTKGFGTDPARRGFEVGFFHRVAERLIAQN